MVTLNRKTKIPIIFDNRFMSNLNFKDLQKLEELNNLKDLNQIFLNLLNEISVYLNLDIINSNFKITYEVDKEDIDFEKQNILDIGVKKNLYNNLLTIKIFKEYQNYLPIILLREAYYCFVPDTLKDNEGIKIIINQIVEINLDKFEIIKEWKHLMRSHILDYDFLAAEFDKLEKFLKMKGDETTESPIKLFFTYIRKNIYLIDDESEEFHDKFLKEFILKSSKSIYSDEIIETIRVLIRIFYKVQSYKALLDYQNHFKRFIENGELQTDLSLRKFSNNTRWINRFSYIGPSYRINYKLINAGVNFCKLTFNPTLEKSKINQIIENLPFFVYSKSSENNFAIEVSGWFVIPLSYQKDLGDFLNRLVNFGYLIEKSCFLTNDTGNFLNLNYFREFYRRGRLVNPDHIQYNKNNEIDFKLKFDRKENFFKLSILDYVVINRAYQWSMDGFSFERQTETTRTIKSDLFNEILSQRRLISRLRNNIESFQENLEVKKKFLNFLDLNKSFGFFYILEILKNLLTGVRLIKTFLNKNSEVKNTFQFQEIIKNKSISPNIDDNIILKNHKIQKLLNRDLIPIYFTNKIEFNKEIKKYQTYFNFFKLCSKLKIFDLKAISKIIEDKDIVTKIYRTKEEKIMNIFQNYKLSNITSKDIEDVLDSFLTYELPVLKPLLINTINTTSFAKYFIELILEDNLRTRNILNKIKKYFPRVINDAGIEINNKAELRLVQIYLPNIKEKEFILSIFFNLFNENLISLKRYFYDGFFKSATLKDFYDLDRKEFFYTKDLFDQYFRYIQKKFGSKLKVFEVSKIKNPEIFWSSEKDFKKLVEQVEDRVSREKLDFNVNKLQNLSKFHQNLQNVLIDVEKFKEIKNNDFFKKCIKSIKFKPVFQNFGFGQYYLHIRPINMNEIDFKLLFINSFQNIKYPAYIDNTPSFFIKYLFPYRKPNMTYINWLAKSKKIISEYCIFFIKKFYPIIHFNQNIGPYGWELESRKFKVYLQKILFDTEFNKQIPKPKGYDFDTLNDSKYYSYGSKLFNDLTEIYSWKLLDLKSVMGTRNYSLIDKISTLIKTNLIVPYIKLKNLDFQDKIYIILPSLKKKSMETLIKIFSYFNYCFIYEIEGEFFIYGNPDIVKFENGLLIKVYLPSTELSDFQRIFDLLFQFFKIHKYLILNDMIDGQNLMKYVYGNLKYLDAYNPLKNLKWNDRDKIWMNHKLFNEKFEPIYPDLLPNEN